MKKQWYWVVGNHIDGFRITTKRPRTKFVREPFESLDLAQRFIRFEILINA